MSVDIENHLDKLFGYAFGLTNDRDDAQDLVQQCALKALTANKVPNKEPDFKYWLFRVLRNTHIDLKRSRLRKSAEPYREGELMNGEDPQNFERQLINQLSVWAAIRTLSDDHREVIVSIDIAGLSYAEAAAMLEVPTGTVMSRLSRARKMLLIAIEKDSVPQHHNNVLPFQSTEGLK